jgi:hypothetical protein
MGVVSRKLIIQSGVFRLKHTVTIAEQKNSIWKVSEINGQYVSWIN